MSASKELSLHQRVGIFYSKNKYMKKSEVVHHFKLEGISSATIYRILDKVDKGISLERKSGSGANRKICQKTKDIIIEQNVNEVGRSYQSIGRKHKIHHKLD